MSGVVWGAGGAGGQGTFNVLTPPPPNLFGGGGGDGAAPSSYAYTHLNKITNYCKNMYMVNMVTLRGVAEGQRVPPPSFYAYAH